MLGIVRARNWLPILGAEGSGVVGVKADGLQGAIVRMEGARERVDMVPVGCGDYPTISGSSGASLFRSGLLNIVAAGGTCQGGGDGERGRIRACNHNPWIGNATGGVSAREMGIMWPTYMALCEGREGISIAK